MTETTTRELSYVLVDEYSEYVTQPRNPSRDVAVTKRVIKSFERYIGKLRDAQSKLTDDQFTSHEDLEERISIWKKEIDKLTNEINDKLERYEHDKKLRILERAMKRKGYPRLRMEEPLSWRNKDGMPLFALLHMPSVNTECIGSITGEMFDPILNLVPDAAEATIPLPVRSAWEDVVDTLATALKDEHRSNGDKDDSDLQEFMRVTGKIPKGPKKSIRKAKRFFGENIFLVAEAPPNTWLEGVELAGSGPFLAVGYHESTQTFWVIDVFHTEPSLNTV